MITRHAQTYILFVSPPITSLVTCAKYSATRLSTFKLQQISLSPVNFEISKLTLPNQRKLKCLASETYESSLLDVFILPLAVEPLSEDKLLPRLQQQLSSALISDNSTIPTAFFQHFNVMVLGTKKEKVVMNS